MKEEEEEEEEGKKKNKPMVDHLEIDTKAPRVPAVCYREGGDDEVNRIRVGNSFQADVPNRLLSPVGRKRSFEDAMAKSNAVKEPDFSQWRERQDLQQFDVNAFVDQARKKLKTKKRKKCLRLPNDGW